MQTILDSTGKPGLSHELSVDTFLSGFQLPLLTMAKRTQASTQCNPQMRLQLVCLSLEDACAAPAKRRHRFHFPANALAEINGVRKVHCRRIGGSKPLGERSVDEGLELTPYVVGSHHSVVPLSLSLTALTDATSGRFIAGVRFAQHVDSAVCCSHYPAMV
jgi:hypothetical protein